METINVHQAKTTLSQLLRQVASGETVIISRNGEPAAKLVPFTEPPKRRVGGRDRNLFRVPDDFDRESKEVTQLFEG